MTEAKKLIELFCSYAPEDEKHCQKMEVHLASLTRQKGIVSWHQQKILPGTNRMQEINSHLDTAQIILLLISPDFLANDNHYTEMQQALERHKDGSARVIPVLLRPVDWETMPISILEPLPGNRKAITNWNNQDEAFLNVALGIRHVIEEIQATHKKQAQQKVMPENIQTAQIKLIQQEDTRMEERSTSTVAEIHDPERPATVFLSYAHEDKEKIQDLRNRLLVRGVCCWHDVSNMPTGKMFDREIKHAIEHEVDGIAILFTPNSLQSDFIWKVEIPAALRTYEQDDTFPIIPILVGVSFEEISQSCYYRNLPDISNFKGLILTDYEEPNAPQDIWNRRSNIVTKHILKAVLTHRLDRIKANRNNYEASLFLKTFTIGSTATSLDLVLDWLNFASTKERIPTPQEWNDILWPALVDVQETISEKIASHHIHLYVKSILPIAIALGFAFRESTRMTLLLEGQKETWRTDIRSTEKEPLQSEWMPPDKDRDQHVAVIEIATSRSTKNAVEDTLSSAHIIPEYHIRLETPEFTREAVRDASHAAAIARQVGQICQNLCDERRVNHIHLFASIPAELAVLIGHQLNALCPITLYEFTSDKETNTNIYKPVGTIQS